MASELREFALFFHQDFSLMAPTMVEGARMYVRALPTRRRMALASEFGSFLEEHRSAKALRNSWIRLGAGYANRGQTLVAQMHEIAELLRPR